MRCPSGVTRTSCSGPSVTRLLTSLGSSPAKPNRSATKHTETHLIIPANKKYCFSPKIYFAKITFD